MIYCHSTQALHTPVVYMALLTLFPLPIMAGAQLYCDLTLTPGGSTRQQNHHITTVSAVSCAWRSHGVILFKTSPCYLVFTALLHTETAESVLLYSVTRLLDLESRYSDECRKKVHRQLHQTFLRTVSLLNSKL